MNQKISIYIFMATLLCLSLVQPLAAKPFINKNNSKYAIGGYDPVAYFTTAQATKGNTKYNYKWNKATWLFSSAMNKKSFVRNPKKYAPQYGGYCAYAVSRGYTAKTDPKYAWTVYKGRLYLNYNKKVQGMWQPTIKDAIKKANKNWPGVLKKTYRKTK